jgi:aquaporin Z
MRKYVTEFIGTFFLVFTVCMAVRQDAVLAPLAIGLVLATMVYAGGHISGGHFNPAVSLAVYLRGRLPVRDLGAYVLAQLVGGAVAAAVAGLVIGSRPESALEWSGRDLGAAFTVEVLMTFALAFVVLNVATSRDHPNNSFYGLAIGSTVLVGAIAVGGLSGGAFNPAVALGVSVAGIVSWSMLWMYLVANLLGGALAAVVFRYVAAEDARESLLDPARLRRTRT